MENKIEPINAKVICKIMNTNKIPKLYDILKIYSKNKVNQTHKY